jgi:hypothetical protein
MLIVLIVSLLLVAVWQYVLSSSAEAVLLYAAYVFTPFQVLRNFLTSWTFVSIGDIIYIGVSLYIIVLIIKWIRKLVKKQVNRQGVLQALLGIFSFAGVVYIWFFLGWGGNYSKQKLSEHWGLEAAGKMSDSDVVSYDRYLVSKLNEYAPQVRSINFEEIEKQSQKYYGQFAATKNKVSSLKVKASLFGNGLEYSGVQGYYNPFTGEGQVNANLPGFMQPFVICHEMAHQAGIAAEDDANLMAFVIGLNSNDADFVYSAYFNVFLYTNNSVRSIDTVLANSIRNTLNPVTLAHIQTMRELRKKYRSRMSEYTGYFYDNFLKLNQQEKGMDSYNDVVYSAWAWEERRKLGEVWPVSIP